MRVLLIFLCWCVLLVLCWPLAIAAALLFPLVWLAALPFRLLAVIVGAMIATLKAILFLPARLLGQR